MSLPLEHPPPPLPGRGVAAGFTRTRRRHRGKPGTERVMLGGLRGMARRGGGPPGSGPRGAVGRLHPNGEGLWCWGDSVLLGRGDHRGFPPSPGLWGPPCNWTPPPSAMFSRPDFLWLSLRRRFPLRPLPPRDDARGVFQSPDLALPRGERHRTPPPAPPRPPPHPPRRPHPAPALAARLFWVSSRRFWGRFRVTVGEGETGANGAGHGEEARN